MSNPTPFEPVPDQTVPDSRIAVKQSAGAILLISIGRLRERLSTVSPPALFAGYLFFAILMILATTATNLSSISMAQGGRDKGYWWELNWGLNHLIVIPVALFCSASLLRRVRDQVHMLAMAHMAVDDHFVDLPESSLRDDWRRYEVGTGWFIVLAALAFAASYAEWWVGSVRPILGFDVAGPPVSDRHLGWTTGVLLDPRGIPKWANLVLSFAAFTAQGFVVTVFGFVFATVLAFSIWIYNYGGPVGPRLIPNLDSPDSRRGFENFEPFILSMLYTGLAFTFVLFFIRIQSVYDYSDSSSKTAYDFLLQDVVKGFVIDAADVLKGQPAGLFDIGNATNYGTMIVWAAMAAMVTVIVMVPTLILSGLARESRESLLRCLAGEDCPPCRTRQLSKAECETRVTPMDFWPLRYPRPMELLAYVVFAGFCFLFYKFTLVFVGVLVIKTVHTVYKGLTTQPTANAAGSS